MNLDQIKEITLSLLDTFKKAGEISLDLRKKGLIKEIISLGLFRIRSKCPKPWFFTLKAMARRQSVHFCL